jgi:D-arabinitol dehydrogenase (NADP+)
MHIRGVTRTGCFADYVTSKAFRVFKIQNMSDIEATLTEPTANAIRVVEVIGQVIASNTLVIGAGPSGLMIAQILRLNGAARVVVAANKGIKTQVAKDLEVFDEVVELDRDDPRSSWSDLTQRYPDGFDVVVEATGSMEVANDAINYVGFGGTLLLYGGYHPGMLSNWSLPTIVAKEIKILSALGQHNGFTRAIAYLESGRLKTKGLVSHTFSIDRYEEAIKTLDSRESLKVAIVP